MKKLLLLFILMFPFCVLTYFESDWQQMQELYRKITTHDKGLVHLVWWEHSQQLSNYILGTPHRNFLSHPALVGTMIRPKIEEHVYEITFLRGLSSEIKDKLGAYKERMVGGLLAGCAEFNCSYNALGHLYYTGQILSSFDMDQIDSITEFGGGYGSLCSIFKSVKPDIQYIIIDLPEIIAIQFLYLNQVLPSKNIHVVTERGAKIASDNSIYLIPINFLSDTDFSTDLFISTFAVSEASEESQKKVTDKDFFGAQFSYIVGQRNHSFFPSERVILDSIEKKYKSVTIKDFHISRGNGNYELWAY